MILLIRLNRVSLQSNIKIESNMSSTKIMRIYGVDFGSHSISISKIDLNNSNSSSMEYDESTNSTKISYLTDFIGKRTIYNGVQYVTPHDECDASTFYKRRNIGNECNRSKYIESILPQTINGITEEFDTIWVPLPKIKNGVDIDRNVARVSIVTQIRQLIDDDIQLSSNSIKSDNIEFKEIRVIFAIPSWFEKSNVTNLMSNIKTLFNMDRETETYPFTLNFISSSHAMSFARFNQVFTNYIQQYNIPKNIEHKVLILNSGHYFTEISEVRTKYDPLIREYTLDVTNSIKFQIGGADMNNRIAKLINCEPFSNDVEKIKHNLSLYKKTYYCDKETKEINRDNIDILGQNLIRMVEKIKEFILNSDCDTIEFAGGFSRSFIFQDMITSIKNKTNKNLKVLRGLSFDEATALGAGVYGAMSMCSLNKTDIKFVRNMDQIIKFDKDTTNNDSMTIENIESWIDKYETYLIGDQSEKNIIYKKTVMMDDNRRLKISNGDQVFEADINTDSKLIDVYFDFDLIDYLKIIKITQIDSQSSLNYKSIDIPFYKKQNISDPDKIEKTEREFRKLHNMHERIGNLYNRMEEFYLDRETYSDRKKVLIREIERVKKSYAYPVSELNKLKKSLRKLLDTYEFCRIVTVEPELINDKQYMPDPDIDIDPRLNRNTVDNILRTEEGLQIMEKMIYDY